MRGCFNFLYYFWKQWAGNWLAIVKHDNQDKKGEIWQTNITNIITKIGGDISVAIFILTPRYQL